MKLKTRIVAALAALAVSVSLFGFTPAPAAPAAASATTELSTQEAAKPDTWAALRMSTRKEPGRREYTDARQVERILALLPTSADRVDMPAKAMGANPVEVEVHRKDAAERYYVYPQGFALKPEGDGSETWYKVSVGLWRLLATMTDWVAYPGYDVKYQDETITEVFSFQYKNRSYHRVNSRSKIAEIVRMLEEKQPDEELTTGNVGFLILTEEGGHSIYLDASSDQALVDLSVECIRDSSPLIQWLVYMNPENIASIRATASVGKNSLAKDSAVITARLETDDRDSIGRIAGYLQNMMVKDDPTLSWDEVDYQGKGKRLTLDITFTSGILYHITADSKTITISCPDMPEHIIYSASPSRLQALSDLISLMPGAALTKAS